MANNNMKNIDLLYEIAYRKVESQNDANRSIDSKVGVLFGFTGIISVWVFGVVIANQTILGWNLFSIGLFIMMASITLSVFAARSRVFFDPIDMDSAYSSKYLKKSHIDLKNQLLADVVDSHQKNQKLISAKSYLFDIAVIALGLTIVLFYLDLII